MPAFLAAQVQVPPLRDRLADLPLLARALVPVAELTPAALQALEQYAWPGNVAELRGALLHAAALAGDTAIDVWHLPHDLRHVPPVDVLIQLPEDGLNMEAVEISLLRQALERAQGNKTRAAELLGLTRHTLLYRLEKYGLDT
jgi:DNA-binding NtrC family response regulator